MIKPKCCKYCKKQELKFIEKGKLFNPETEVFDMHDYWECVSCKTTHVDTIDFTFFDVTINKNKVIQEESSNVGSWLKK